jgi:cell division septation protein DedD
MRAFLILLIIANMAYFAWRENWFGAPAPLPEAQQSRFRQAEQALTLLNELSDERLELMGSLAEARTARLQAVGQLQQVQEQVQAVAGAIEENAAEFAEDQAGSAQVQQELLQTLDSRIRGNDDGVANDDEVANSDGVAAAPAPLQPWCANTALFPDQAAAAAFAQGLIDLGAEASLEQGQTPVSSTWWVYLPPFAVEAEARAVLAELQGKGIDSYYMRSGDMTGGISLGVYSREESARIAQRQLAGQGYTTSLREVFRLEERPYVRLVLPDGRLRNRSEWSTLVATAGAPELTEFTCDPVASQNEFP